MRRALPVGQRRLAAPSLSSFGCKVTVGSQRVSEESGLAAIPCL